MGGGRTAYAVVGGMREGDPTGSIPLINEERHALQAPATFVRSSGRTSA